MSNDNSPIDEQKFPDILDTLHQEHWYVTKLLVLLIIICIASLGSLSLAPHFLPLDSQIQPTSIPKYSDGKCDSNADPDTIHYIPLLSLPKSPNTSITPSKSPNTSTTPSKSPNTSTTPSKPSSITPMPSTNKKLSFNITTIDPGAGGLSINSDMGYGRLSRSQAKPTQAPPTPTPSSTLGPLPANWYSEGLIDDDARYAAACAAIFVQTYHTYDASNPSTFESAVYMLSTQAKRNFYLGGPDDTYNIHLRMLASWQRTAESRQQIERTTVAMPTILDLYTLAPTHTITVRVGYNLTKQTDNQVTPFVKYDTVKLQSTSPSPSLPMEKIGWQVIAWQDADE